MDEISDLVWRTKYRQAAPDGGFERSIEETWSRVAKALSEPERDASSWYTKYHQAFCQRELVPGGRIIVGAGSGRTVTLYNTFVMGDVPDDFAGVMDSLQECAETMRQGGGIGCNFSAIRPSGSLIRGVGGTCPGPLPFLGMWNSTCEVILQGGARRGAMIAILACDHPDIEQFIESKTRPGALQRFNISVGVTDAFMTAVRQDRDWDLQYGGRVAKTISARKLWDKIMAVTYEYSEPGVLFLERMNRQNNLYYCEKITGTNSCGEQPLPPYGACPLASVNLAELVRNPFTPQAALDESRLEELVNISVRMLDTVVDLSTFPVAEQAKLARASRRLGVGITGLADALIFCNLRYGSQRAIETTERWMKAFQRASYVASMKLARERGASFPLYDAAKFGEGFNVRRLDTDLQKDIQRHGLRNGVLNTVAPTGSTSLLCNNVSSGLEPVFSFKSVRKVVIPDGDAAEIEILDNAYSRFRQIHGESAALPETFVDMTKLTPEEHLAMQAAVQKYVDASISKTINCPTDIDFKSLSDVYVKAYDSGCKGCTTYRYSPLRGSVISIADL